MKGCKLCIMKGNRKVLYIESSTLEITRCILVEFPREAIYYYETALDFIYSTQLRWAHDKQTII